MVYRRPGTSKWYMDFTITWNAKTYRVNKSTKESDEALAREVEEQERNKLNLRLRGKLTGDDMTLSEAADRMLKRVWCDKADGPNQYTRVKRLIDIHGDVKLASIDSEWVDTVREDLRAHGKSKATVNRYLCHVRAIISAARNKWGIQVGVPQFEMYRETPGRLRIVSQGEEEEILRLLRSAPVCETQSRQYKHHPAYADLFAVLLDTGMRLGEALQLDYKSSIDLDQKVIHLYADQTKPGRCRSIPMTARVAKILAARKVDGNRPFPWTKDRIEKVWTWVRKQTGVEDKEFVIHSLRHTFASRLVQHGADLLGVKKLMGHSQWSTTERYAHLDMTNHRGMINILNKVPAPVGETVGVKA